MVAGGDTGIDTHWLAIALDIFQARLVAGGSGRLYGRSITLSVAQHGVDAQTPIDYANEHLRPKRRRRPMPWSPR
jgi:hypothetical protein